MGGGIVFLFYLVVIGIFLLLWGGSLGFFLWGRKKGSKSLYWVFGVVFVLCSIVGVYGISKVVIGYSQFTNPVVIFERSFGFEPTSDVSEIKSSYWYFADTGLTYLKFKASTETIQKIAERGLVSTNEGKFFNLLESGLDKGAPEWWKPTKSNSLQFFFVERENRDFSHETELLCYDSFTGITYYCFSGID